MIFLLLNTLIFLKERAIAHSVEIKIALKPIDPRSLIQGDYMHLAYKIPLQVTKKEMKGQLKITIDSDGFVKDYALYYNEALKKNQYLLNFTRKKNRSLHIGSETFLFQEGKADYFAKATHALFYLSPSGETILKELYIPHNKNKKDNL